MINKGEENLYVEFSRSGLTRGNAEELAHELYGEDEEEPSVTEKVPMETVVEPLP